MSSLSRRTFLGAAGAVAGAAVVGCDGSSPTARSGPAGTGAPDAELVAAAVTTHRALLASYGGIVRAHPSTRPEVKVLMDQLGEHLSALGAPTHQSGRPPPARRRRPEALTALRDAEAGASADRVADSRFAESGDVARVLASVAACHAQHVDVLDDLLRAGR
ncbi:MAG: twin-arginine translocation signal domain-containing protein [Nocardioidaceae bacterium]